MNLRAVGLMLKFEEKILYPQLGIDMIFRIKKQPRNSHLPIHIETVFFKNSDHINKTDNRMWKFDWEIVEMKNKNNDLYT